MATGTPSTVSAPVFHSDDTEQTTEYRTLSVLAIIALALGVLAPLAFATPLLIVIPLCGIAIAILALRQIAHSGGGLAGGWAATAGLALCVAGAVAPLSRDMVFRAIRTHEAKSIARDWLALLASGEVERAFSETVDGRRQKSPPAPGEPPPAKTPYQVFIEQPVVTALKGAGADANVRFVGTVKYDPLSYRNVIVEQQFVVSPSGGAPPIDVVIGLQRAQVLGEGGSRWLVTRCDDAKTKTASAPAL